jgi:hypothetical protein
MKTASSLASFALVSLLGLVLLRAETPARAAQGGAAPSLEARVAALEGELAAECQRHDETRAMLEQTLGYLEKQSKAAQALLAQLDEAEAQGFAVGENWRSRQTLLAGFRAYWSGASSGLPKLPAPAPAKPAAPTRPARSGTK